MKHGMILLMLVLPVFVMSCDQTADMKQERAHRAERSRGDIVIGAVGNWKGAELMQILYKNGLDMAVNEINAAGGVLGRKIRPIILDDGGTVSDARIAAQKLADNPDVVAVIGHLESDITIAVSITYSYNGMILLSPLTTAEELTRQRGFRFITPVGGFSPPDRVLGPWSKPPAFSRILFQLAVQSASSLCHQLLAGGC